LGQLVLLQSLSSAGPALFRAKSIGVFFFDLACFINGSRIGMLTLLFFFSFWSEKLRLRDQELLFWGSDL